MAKMRPFLYVALLLGLSFSPVFMRTTAMRPMTFPRP